MQHPTDVENTDGHGTKVATLAAAPANGKGSVGVSPNSNVLVVRVTLDNRSDGSARSTTSRASPDGPQLMVVNVSFAFPAAPSGAHRPRSTS